MVCQPPVVNEIILSRTKDTSSCEVRQDPGLHSVRLGRSYYITTDSAATKSDAESSMFLHLWSWFICRWRGR